MTISRVCSARPARGAHHGKAKPTCGKTGDDCTIKPCCSGWNCAPTGLCAKATGGSCVNEGGTCATASDCCSNLACVGNVCTKTSGACPSGQTKCAGKCVDSNTDANNCGGCGNVCSSLPNATATCSNGVCQVGVCATGYANCNGLASDGCETNTQTDPNNCGTCGTICNLPHATATCSSGACAIASCNAGYADCNQRSGDGCEVTLATDTNNCGSCGHACSFPNATATCSSGACQVGACATGYANCDGNATNGCEANLATDKNNCGACGHVCGSSQTCQNGACQDSGGSCPAGQSLCAAGEVCSKCCVDGDCAVVNPADICASVPQGATWGRFCCLPLGTACISWQDCCSGECSNTAAEPNNTICRCKNAGGTCSTSLACCSGLTCSTAGVCG